MDRKTEEYLGNQLAVARKEIQNLRKQIRALAHVHQTDLKNIKDLLKEFKCPSCRLQTNKEPSTSSLGLKDNDASGSKSRLKSIEFNAIGEIRTEFSEKRAVPRQPTVCSKLLGRIELSKDLFTNIEHSLDGLTDFSHLWIIYHFHRNEAHAKAKVAPPRLGGQRVGIFSTRSPHRPCPIGLSLVEIDHVDGKNIYFRGTDMVDGTPVLDIKPYIPRYDNPVLDVSECHPKTVVENVQTFDAREEPDGEETVSSAAIAASTSTAHRLPLSSLSQSNRCDQSPGYLRDDTAGVKVPKWVLAETSLDVLFNERANQQIAELEVNRMNIAEVLKNDPRSVYLRTRYGSQIFTFQLGEVTVTCKFDDANATVTVVQVRKLENLSTEPLPPTD